MYKIMIYIDTHSGDKWFYYQENEKDYVAYSLHEIKETVLTLIDTYGKDNIKIVKQVTGEDMEGSVETFIYDSTDNYEELVNRPSINGVEIIGQLSLDDLGIQPAGDYATSERVDVLEETVNNIDFSSYATNTRVDQIEHKVDNIDLTSYATNERVDQVEAKVDAIDLEPYATTDYLDEVVAGIDFSASNENITGVKTFSVLPRSTVVPVTEDELTNKSYVDHEVLGCATEEYVDAALDEYMPYLTFPNWVSAFQSVSLPTDQLPIVSKMITDNLGKFAKAFVYVTGVPASGVYFGKVESSKPTIIKLYSHIPVNKAGVAVKIRVYITGTWDGDTFTCTSAILEGGGEDSFLTWWTALAKNNTRAFTPTGDYNPATKKYVDDSISAIPVYEEPEVKTYYFDWSDLVEISLNAYNSYDVTLPEEDIERLTTIINEEFNRNFMFVFALKYGRIAIGDTCRSDSARNGYYCIQVHTISGATDAAQKYASVNCDFYIETTYDEASNTAALTGKLTITPQYNTSIPNYYYVNNNFLSKTNTSTYNPTANYHPATKKYVDSKVNLIKQYDFRFTNTQINGGSTHLNLDDSEDAQLSTILTDAYQSGVSTLILKLIFTHSNPYTATYIFHENIQDKPTTLVCYGAYNGFLRKFVISGSWEGDSFTSSGSYVQSYGSNLGIIYSRDKLVTEASTVHKYNLVEYTPTSDYHPATKKYVDDSIAAIDIPTGSSNAIEQVETLPTGSEELVGTVYQYIGATNTSYGYVHGNYYICTKRMYLNKHNDRRTSYPWVNAQYENIVEEIPMHEYRNTSDVKFLTPGEHQVWGGTTFDVASGLSKILKRYTSDYDTALFLYSERLTSDTQEYVSVLFTVSYNTIIDNVEYQVFEGITHSIKNPGKTAHVILKTAISGFNDYSCSPVFIVTEQSGANLDNYYTKEEVDAAIAAAITTVLEGEY